jgi:glycerol-3-phosphate O-acyltransferase
MAPFLERVGKELSAGHLPEKFGETLIDFYDAFAKTLHSRNLPVDERLLDRYLDEILKQVATPYTFQPYHKALTSPFNYTQFGLDFIKPLVIFEQSKVLGLDNVSLIDSQLKNGDNVVLLSNHQTEPDPQLIHLLLQEKYPEMAREMIFVAGDRVVTDPLSVPFSLGCNLLCIYSKRHIDNPPEQRAEKLQHNARTMKMMGELLSEGGKCIYVAPSGGRDRLNEEGVLTLAPFDPQSIGMFHLMAQQAARPTHFYPLAIASYAILPPPKTVEKELGERRTTECHPVHLAFGKEIDMNHFPGVDSVDKKEQRQKRAEYIWSLVAAEYSKITE